MHVSVLRDSKPYLLDFGFVLFMLTASSLVVFIMQPGELADRSAHLLGLVLTVIAFKFAIAGSMPRVGYLTLVDVYLLLCLAFMFLLMLESAFVAYLARYHGSDLAVNVDEHAGVTAAGLFLLKSLLCALFSRSMMLKSTNDG